jgi:hypothetical protein
MIPCKSVQRQLNSFMKALEKRLIQYNISLTRKRDEADAFLQGEVSIYDDRYGKLELPPDVPMRISGSPYWKVEAWLVNANSMRLWESDGYFKTWAGPLFVGTPAQVEGKQLAKELEVELRRAKKK